MLVSDRELQSPCILCSPWSNPPESQPQMARSARNQLRRAGPERPAADGQLQSPCILCSPWSNPPESRPQIARSARNQLQRAGRKGRPRMGNSGVRAFCAVRGPALRNLDHLAFFVRRTLRWHDCTEPNRERSVACRFPAISAHKCASVVPTSGVGAPATVRSNRERSAPATRPRENPAEPPTTAPHRRHSESKPPRWPEPPSINGLDFAALAGLISPRPNPKSGHASPGPAGPAILPPESPTPATKQSSPPRS